MANEDQLRIIRQGVDAWNEWRKGYPEEYIDLREANLSKVNLDEANLYRANLYRANLVGTNLNEANLYRANLIRTNLNEANLNKADLYRANLSRASLDKANLSRTNLNEANLYRANIRGADLSGANLTRANLVETNLERATLTGCRIYGISSWDSRLQDAVQIGLIVSPPDKPTITVDNLEVAQFIYLLLHNEKIRHVIDTITSKVVLILGRFTPERKAILDAIREELRRRDYLPVLFDFEKSESRDLTETISTLAHMARFIIADITDPKSIPLELQAIIPDLAVPVQPLLLKGASEFSMFRDLRRKYHWVLQVHTYKDPTDLFSSFEEKVIAPAVAKVIELRDDRK